MPNYRRLFVPGGTYFFTVNLQNRKSDVLVKHIHLLRQSWRDVRRAWPFETLAVVILPEHLHTVISLPDGDDNFPVRLRLLKSGFTRRLPEAVKSTGRKGERSVWQRRYWEHHIRDEEDLDASIEYVHRNPVKHGFVEHPDDWPYSTWHRYKRETGLIFPKP